MYLCMVMVGQDLKLDKRSPNSVQLMISEFVVDARRRGGSLSRTAFMNCYCAEQVKENFDCWTKQPSSVIILVKTGR